MNEEDKRKCSCPYCPGHAEIQRYTELQLEEVPKAGHKPNPQMTFDEYIIIISA